MLPESDNQKEEIHLKEYLQVVLRRKWIVFAFFVILVSIVALNSFKATPIYQAKVQVLINKENPNVISFKEVMSLDRRDMMFYKTQQKILSSRALARRVIDSLNLKDSPEFKSDKTSNSFSIRGWVRSLAGGVSSKKSPKQNSTEDNAPDNANKLVNRYLSGLKVEIARNSRFVSIMFKGAYPEIITKIVNQHAQEYIEYNLEMRFAASQDAVEWLQKQLFEKKKKVENAENALQLYKERKQIVSLEDRQNIIVQKLEELNTALTNARTSRITIETLNNQAKKSSNDPETVESIPDIMKNPLIQDLKREYIRLYTEITKLSSRYGEKHPTMLKLISHAKEQKKRIKVEVNKIVNSIETEYQVALAKEVSLSNALEEQKKVALDLNKKAIAYGTLKREADSEKAMYDILLKRLRETDITGELKTSNVRVIDNAEVPGRPIRPRKKRNITLAAIVGLILGAGMVFFLEYMDNTIKNSEDVERYLGLPLLGVLQKIKITKNRKGTTDELIAHEEPKSTFAEGVRNVRTNIVFTSTDKPRKSMLVTSTSQGEGKTFVVANLAITFAKTGKKTLLVDTDFRRPKVNKVFNVAMKPGLSNHLIGECDLDSIIRDTGIPHLSVIPCGVIPPDPAEMLGTQGMEKFYKNICDRFDTILFDTPPSMVVTDAAVLSNIVDAVVFVVKSGTTVKGAAKRAVEQLTSKKRDVLGIIMNYADISRGGYYYHYYAHYYKYGYGDDGTTESKEKTA